MATTNLLLLKPLENLGNEGEEVKVRSGYARNYLLPRKLAVPVTRANRRQMEALAKARENRLRNELADAQETAKKLEALRIAIAVKTGPGGKIFGSVTAQNLSDRIAEEGITLDRRQLSLYTPVKSLGKHTTRIRLHSDVSVDFEFEVVSENPIEEDQEGDSSDSETSHA